MSSAQCKRGHTGDPQLTPQCRECGSDWIVDAGPAPDPAPAAPAAPGGRVSLRKGEPVTEVVSPTPAPAPVPEPAAVVAPLRLTVGSRTITIADGETVGLGRSPDYPHADLFAPESGFDNVSRIHAALRYAGGRVYVTDLGSSNGTFVNGTRIESGAEYEVHPGQALRLAADVPLGLDWGTP
ncbi:FHA domain-containing protein [Gordonia crocea]|uniref:FHA domain-containing protein n=1 Tax=Gordonia crocea TaxID=589162 RepID=A0A7M4BQ21_9ACTN|nr:FHA domain-containing protein [Gordonia crocea]GED95982.1 hypothetical protein nbrc107697_00210 [Gordonia crocea]